MADESIRVAISPTSAAAGRRLVESSPSSSQSFVSDKFTGGGARFAAPGTGQRSEINVNKKLVDVQTALVAEIRELRKTMRSTAPGTSERTSLQGRIDDLLQQQKRQLTGAADAGAIAREKALSTAKGAAIMPSARVLARSLYGAGQSALAGNPLGAVRHVGEAFAAGRYLAGAGAAAAGASGAEGAAAGAAEAAGGIGGIGVGSALAAVGLGGAAFEAWEHPEAAKNILKFLPTVMAAKRYGGEEEPRQALAFRAAREFGESGSSMIGAATGGRWSALGIEPSEATATVASMRELGGSRYVSNAQAFKGAQLGTYLGFSPEQSAQVGGQAGRLGVSPESAIRTIAAGVERGNQQGRQFEVASASLDYLKQIATSAAVSGTTGLTAITNLSAILAKSGIAGFQGAQGVSAISGIESAHAADDLFGVQAAGAAFVQLGEANILRGVNADKRFAGRTPGARVALAEQIRQQGFSGPFADIYGRAIHGEIATAESTLGRDLGLTAFEQANALPIGGYRDASGKWVSVNDSVTAMDAAFQSGDFQKASSIQSDLLSRGKGNISPMESATAGLATERALTGESTARTFAAGEKLEAAGIGLLRRYVSDRSSASALDYLSTTLGPSKPGSATAASAITGYGLGDVLGKALSSGPVAAAFDAAGTAVGAVGSYELGGGGAAALGSAGALSGISDSVSGGILLIAGLLERLIAAVQGGSSPSSAPAAPPAPGSMRRAAEHGPTGPTASTPKSRH